MLIVHFDFEHLNSIGKWAELQSPIYHLSQPQPPPTPLPKKKNMQTHWVNLCGTHLEWVPLNQYPRSHYHDYLTAKIVHVKLESPFSSLQ